MICFISCRERPLWRSEVTPSVAFRSYALCGVPKVGSTAEQRPSLRNGTESVPYRLPVLHRINSVRLLGFVDEAFSKCRNDSLSCSSRGQRHSRFHFFDRYNWHWRRHESVEQLPSPNATQPLIRRPCLPASRQGAAASFLLLARNKPSNFAERHTRSCIPAFPR
jgi:hypothetical protein